MDILNQLETHPIPIEEEERRHTRRLLVGVLCALLLTGLVFGGYIYLRKRHERQLAAAASELEVKKKTAQVEVLVDEPVVNGKTCVLSGTVRNISNETLQNLAVELQLRRKVGGGVDLRVIVPESADLAPGATTRYMTQVSAQDYISTTFLRVVGGSDRAAIPSRAKEGNPAPPMESPGSKTVVVEKSRSGKRDEFLNTPNNPGRVP